MSAQLFAGDHHSNRHLEEMVQARMESLGLAQSDKPCELCQEHERGPEEGSERDRDRERDTHTHRRIDRDRQNERQRGIEGGRYI